MKIAVEAPRKKNHIVQCTRCQFYGHTKITAPDHMFALSVGANTIGPCGQNTLMPQSRVLYVTENTRRATNDVLYINNLQQARDKTHRSNHPTATQTSTTPVNINDTSQFPLPYKVHSVPAPEPPPFPFPSPYSYIATHHQQPINVAKQLSTYLNEFKTMFGQLIQQNGLILNMLSTVIQKLNTHCPPPLV